MIRFEQVGKRYPNGHVGLHEVSFRVHRGEILRHRPPGAGKSTLLRLILAMERPTSGKLLLGGQDRASLPRRSLSCAGRSAWCSRTTNCSPIVRWRTTSALPLQILGMPAGDRCAWPRPLERVNLKEKGEALPSDLSTGQQQRVGIAAPSSTSRPCCWRTNPPAT